MDDRLLCVWNIQKTSCFNVYSLKRKCHTCNANSIPYIRKTEKVEDNERLFNTRQEAANLIIY